MDDERPALDELAYLLARDHRVGEVVTSDSATEGLRILQERDVDVVFLDIQMPGLTGLELAQVLARFRTPPPIVFVTAHEEHAVDAFDLQAVDYVLKPVRARAAGRGGTPVVEGGERSAPTQDSQVPVERGGVTRFINRSDITHVEAQGDYARLHTAEGSHLVRTPLSALEEEWASAGFVRIHRSLLVSLAHVRRAPHGRRPLPGRVDGPTGGIELAVSRRHTRELRDLLLRRAGSRERAAAPGAGPGHRPAAAS